MVLMKKFKAVIINPDRTTTVKIIGKKKRIGANAFYMGKNKSQIEEVYIINPDHTIITTTKKLGVPFNYQTCYYKKNVPVPTPINLIDGGQGSADVKYIYDKKDKKDGTRKVIGQEITVIKPLSLPDLDHIKYDDISSEELAVLFNPQFYKMIARANVNKKEEQMWLMQICSLGGIAFILYYMIQNLPKVIIKGVLTAMGGG